MSLRICPSGPGKGHAFVGGMIPEKGDDYCQADCVRILGSLPGSCFLGGREFQEVGVILDRAKILVEGAGREEGGSAVHINTHTRVCIVTHTRTQTHTLIHTCPCTHMYTQACTCIHMHVHTLTHAYTNSFTPVHAHTGMHAYIHTHMHMHTHSHMSMHIHVHAGLIASLVHGRLA